VLGIAAALGQEQLHPVQGGEGDFQQPVAGLGQAGFQGYAQPEGRSRIAEVDLAQGAGWSEASLGCCLPGCSQIEGAAGVFEGFHMGGQGELAAVLLEHQRMGPDRRAGKAEAEGKQQGEEEGPPPRTAISGGGMGA